MQWHPFSVLLYLCIRKRYCTIILMSTKRFLWSSFAFGSIIAKTLYKTVRERENGRSFFLLITLATFHCSLCKMWLKNTTQLTERQVRHRILLILAKVSNLTVCFFVFTLRYCISPYLKSLTWHLKSLLACKKSLFQLITVSALRHSYLYRYAALLLLLDPFSFHSNFILRFHL